MVTERIKLVYKDLTLMLHDSLIRKLLLEAETLTLPPAPQAVETDLANSASMGIDAAGAMQTPPAAPQQSMIPGMGAPASLDPLRNLQAPQTTIQKTVINKDVVKSQLSELKSIITNYEKKFEGDDLTPADAAIHINALLSSLVFHGERLSKFLAPPEAPETPLAEPPMDLEEPALDLPVDLGTDMPSEEPTDLQGI